MNWEAIGDFVGGLAVVFTLIYIAFQVRQNSKQMDQNSRALAASTHYAAGEGFNRWFALIIQDEALANLWRQGLAGETLNPADRLRFRSMATMLFTTLENNFHQLQLGSHSRNTMQLGKRGWVSLLSSPGGSDWWKRQGRQSFSPEFVEAIETMVAAEGPEESGKQSGP